MRGGIRVCSHRHRRRCTERARQSRRHYRLDTHPIRLPAATDTILRPRRRSFAPHCVARYNPASIKRIREHAEEMQTGTQKPRTARFVSDTPNCAPIRAASGTSDALKTRYFDEHHKRWSSKKIFNRDLCNGCLTVGSDFTLDGSLFSLILRVGLFIHRLFFKYQQLTRFLCTHLRFY